MRFVPVNCIKEGMILAQDLFNANGDFLLRKGAKLHSSYIQRLNDLGLVGVYVDDDLSSEIDIPSLISEDLKIRTVSTIKGIFVNLEEGSGLTEKNFNDVTKLVDEIVDEIIASRELVVNMIDLKVFDDYTFYHSVNVTVLSLVVGVALSLNKTQLYKLGLAALLHDIGKVFIPKKLLNKPSKLEKEEYELIKTHPYKGYKYLKEKFDMPVVTYIGILQHHERFDGEGYPYNIAGHKISLFGRIISISDVYDALTSKRPYREALSPSEAVEYIMAGSGTLFDPDLVSNFLKKVSPYPVGSCVLLSNNKVGIVSKNYPDACLRPQLKIIMHGNEAVKPYYMDMKNDKNTYDVTIIGIANV